MISPFHTPSRVSQRTPIFGVPFSILCFWHSERWCDWWNDMVTSRCFHISRQVPLDSVYVRKTLGTGYTFTVHLKYLNLKVRQVFRSFKKIVTKWKKNEQRLLDHLSDKIENTKYNYILKLLTNPRLRGRGFGVKQIYQVAGDLLTFKVLRYIWPHLHVTQPLRTSEVHDQCVRLLHGFTPGDAAACNTTTITLTIGNQLKMKHAS